MKLIDSQTYINLANAFAGETQARTRYEFIEYGARNQGYEAIAQIIDKIAYQEFNHARMFYTKLQSASNAPIEKIAVNFNYPFREKWDLTDNLQLASIDEHEEGTTVYPSAAKTAEKEGFPDIADLFSQVALVEKRHERIFKELYEQMKNNTLYSKEKPVKWVCPVCGYEHTSLEPWEKCPVCLSPRETALLQIKTT